MTSRGDNQVARVILAVTQKTAKSVALLISGGLLILNLTACGGSSWLGLGGSSEVSQPLAATSAPSQPATPPVAFGQIFGAPTNVAAKFNESLASAGKEQNVQIVQGGDAEYTVKGYLVATAESKGIRLTYKWDISDKAGKRLKRIEGGEIVSEKKAGDPWAAVSDAAIQTVANKTVAALQEWLMKPAPAAAATPVANARPAAAPGHAAAMTPAPAAAPKGDSVVMVIPVAGAPGDGQSALADAMKKHLTEKGIKVTDVKTPGAYSVKGTVTMGAAEGGQQPITIRWSVIDPAGKQIGNAVVQKNKVDQGSLDVNWGQVADIAAGAAAVELAKIAPKPAT
jgi:hypothetical protein